MKIWKSVPVLVFSLLALGVAGFAAASGSSRPAVGTIIGVTCPGLTVAIQGTGLSALADPKTGRFEIQNVPVGIYYTVVAAKVNATDDRAYEGISVPLETYAALIGNYAAGPSCEDACELRPTSRRVWPDGVPTDPDRCFGIRHNVIVTRPGEAVDIGYLVKMIPMQSKGPGK